MPIACSICNEGPASVFTTEHPLCKPCFRELRRQEAEDNPIANAPTCPCCGLLVNNRAGICTDCFASSLRQTAVPA